MSAAALFLLVPLTALSVNAPVTAVTVYSDRARVTRTATLALDGPTKVELPLLPDTVDSRSIRIETSGGALRRVDIVPVTAEAFPRDEARLLLDEIEALDDQRASARADRDDAAALEDGLDRLHPTPASGATGDPLKPSPRLDASGWSATLGFVATWSDRLQAQVRAADERLAELDRRREGLLERARLLGGVRRRGGLRVAAVLDGHGPARVTLSYLAGGAAWRPSYDLQLSPADGKVKLSFGGRVVQTTGEDWTDAALTLSTAEPATSTEYPRLATWKIGSRERFLPTPEPADDKPPPPPAVPARFFDDEVDPLRARLVAATTRASNITDEKNVATPPQESDVVALADNVRDGIARLIAAAHRDKDVILLNCLNEKLTQIESNLGIARRATDELRAATSRSDADDQRHQRARLAILHERMASLRYQAMQCQGSNLVTVSDEVVATRQSESLSLHLLAGSLMGSYRRPAERVPVGVAPPPGYRPRNYAPDLPVSLAGGYDLAFPSLRPETVASGKGERRVALWTETWPITVERRVLPALSPEAYLVAELKNPSSRALPGGTANLFVGADPAGVARFPFVAPGETLTLPLGLDHAVRPIRNVALVESEHGFLARDEVGEYTVTTEIANPHPTPIAVRIVDQYPVTQSKDVEIRLLRVEPAPAAEDAVKGSLEWRLTVAPSEKRSVRFVYTLRRPKGWRMHQ